MSPEGDDLNFHEFDFDYNLAGNPIEVILPFPTKGCLVLDVNGEPAKFHLEQRLMSRARLQAWHEWRDFQDFADQWFAASMGKTADITVFNYSRDIPHHRKLVVNFDNGQVLKIRFDQGMGYWRIDFPYVWRSFDFNDDVTSQLHKMAKACMEGKVVNGEENWSTDVVVEVIEP